MNKTIHTSAPAGTFFTMIISKLDTSSCNMEESSSSLASSSVFSSSRDCSGEVEFLLDVSSSSSVAALAASLLSVSSASESDSL